MLWLHPSGILRVYRAGDAVCAVVGKAKTARGLPDSSEVETPIGSGESFVKVSNYGRMGD